MFDLGTLIAGLKLPTKTIVAVCLATGILIFSSDRALESFGLQTLVSELRPYFGGLFIVSFCVVAVTLMFAIGTFFKPWLTQAFWIRQHSRRLHSLTPEEKAILSHYIDNKTRSQSLDVRSGVVNALVGEKIITRGSSLGSLTGFDYVIQPWAWEYLNKKPHLLK